MSTVQIQETKSKNSIHQPIVICLDTSGSMLMDAGNGVPKLKIVEEMINSLKNIDLSETEKNAVDICILGFDSRVYTIQDWIPLGDFNGNIKLEAEGPTVLNSVILESIKKVREKRKAYASQNVKCRRAQIFVYTDGFSTEPMEQAYDKSQEYFNRDQPKPSAKLNMICIPTFYEGKIISLTDQENWEEYKEMVQGLGKKVAFLNAKDCVNGIPAGFKFMIDSIVEWSVSAPGQEVRVDMSKELTAVKNHGGVQNQDGTNTVIDNDITDEIELV